MTPFSNDAKKQFLNIEIVGKAWNVKWIVIIYFPVDLRFVSNLLTLFYLSNIL